MNVSVKNKNKCNDRILTDIILGTGKVIDSRHGSSVPIGGFRDVATGWF